MTYIVFVLLLFLSVLKVDSFLLHVPNGLHTVTTPVGDIVGTTSIVDNGSYKVNRYLGIPYAESTTGDRRFRKPVPKAKFASPFNATVFGPACIQIQVFKPKEQSIEDCLVLNIYAPGTGNNSSTKLFPVMIFIHGGGFTTGASNFYYGDALSALGDVIVVTINYRLAVMGFLTTGDSIAPGNMGLWDQHLAFQWVHKNIQAFGGDKSRVTIFGQSGGAVAVIYQTMYPGNKGLFQRAIAESGTIDTPWSNVNLTEAVNNAVQFSHLLGCSSDSLNASVICLRSKSASDINKTMNEDAMDLSMFTWYPVIDNEFVLDNPRDILNGRSKSKPAMDMFASVDLIIGVNSKEGYEQWLLTQIMLQNHPIAADIAAFQTIPKNGFETIFVPSYVESQYKTKPDIAVEMTIFEYTDWSDPSDNYKRTDNAINLVTDAWFNIQTVQTANLHSTLKTSNTTASTYMYRFSYGPHESILPVSAAMVGPTVANHGDELLYLFNDLMYAFTGEHGHKESEMMTKTMITLWTNFAKSGNPNLPVDVSQYINTTWPEYESSQNYLDISPDMTPKSVHQRLAPRAVEFWLKLLPEIIENA